MYKPKYQVRGSGWPRGGCAAHPLLLKGYGGRGAAQRHPQRGNGPCRECECPKKQAPPWLALGGHRTRRLSTTDTSGGSVTAPVSTSPLPKIPPKSQLAHQRVWGGRKGLRALHPRGADAKGQPLTCPGLRLRAGECPAAGEARTQPAAWLGEVSRHRITRHSLPWELRRLAQPFSQRSPAAAHGKPRSFSRAI